MVCSAVRRLYGETIGQSEHIFAVLGVLGRRRILNLFLFKLNNFVSFDFEAHSFGASNGRRLSIVDKEVGSLR